MARTPRSTTPVVYQINVTLKGSKPPIWRRMQVTSDTTLVQLHRILQRVMGWEGYHLYRFVIGGIAYGDPGLLGELEAEDVRPVTLETIVRGEQFKFLYEYDFGDSWEHELRIEKMLPLEEGMRDPSASPTNAPVHRRIAVVAGDTLVFWKRSKIRNFQSTARWWNGWEASSIRKPLIRTRSARSYNASHNLRQG